MFRLLARRKNSSTFCSWSDLTLGCSELGHRGTTPASDASNGTFAKRCSNSISFERKISVSPPSESSFGWLKQLTKLVPNLTSGVKNFETHTTSLLRTLPFVGGLRADARIGALENLACSLRVECPN